MEHSKQDDCMNSRSYRSIDIDSYLHQIEDEVRSYPPNSPRLKAKITETHRKTMLRTLLGYSSSAKIEYDQMLRDRRNEMEYKRLSDFMTQQMRPVILSSNTIAPEIRDTFEMALEKALASSSCLNNAGLRFGRVASGRMYRGSIKAMLKDLAPDLLPSYDQISKPLKEDDAIVIENIINNAPIDEQLKEIAKECLYMDLATEIGGISDERARKGGLSSESTLIHYLTTQRCKNDSDNCFENVFVKKITYKSEEQQEKQIQKLQQLVKENSAFIVTAVEQYNATGEFDAVIVVQQQQQEQQQNETNSYVLDHHVVSEVWESKLTINPVSLHDAIMKKLASLQDLVENTNTLLLHKNGIAKMKLVGTKCLHFGIFGFSILSPARAVSQLKLMVCLEMLGRDKDLVLQAIENKMITIDAEAILAKISSLRKGLADFDKVCVELIVFDTNKT